MAAAVHRPITKGLYRRLALTILFPLALPATLQAQQGHAQHRGQAAPAGRAPQSSGVATTQPQAAVKLPACPVTGDAIDFSILTATETGPVYFSKESCIATYEAAPEKYAEKVAAQRAALRKLPRVQVVCPVMGGAIDKAAAANTSEVHFCCPNCKPTFEKNPARFKANLESAYAYQTKCPVTGEPIDPAVHRDLATYQRVYFHTEQAADAFLKDPGQYASNLAAQGVHVDVAKLKEAMAAQPADGQPGKGHGCCH